MRYFISATYLSSNQWALISWAIHKMNKCCKWAGTYWMKYFIWNKCRLGNRPQEGCSRLVVDFAESKQDVFFVKSPDYMPKFALHCTSVAHNFYKSPDYMPKIRIAWQIDIDYVSRLFLNTADYFWALTVVSSKIPNKTSDSLRRNILGPNCIAPGQPFMRIWTVHFRLNRVADFEVRHKT